jgi:ABC-type transport system involved in multi-copper enzyme maturation permease subunit
LFLVRILAVAAVEYRGIVRSHPFLVFLPAAALLVVGAPALIFFAFEQQEAMQAQVGVSTAVFFATILALLAGASTLPRERETGVRDVLLGSPLTPGTWIAGKWLGICGAVLLAVAVLGGVHLVSVELRGGAPLGYGPFLAALLLAVVQGALAGAGALAFGARLRSGPALVASLILILAGHGAGLAGEGALGQTLRFLLPRAEALNLAGEAVFGPFGAPLWLAAALHGLLYAGFLLTVATLLTATSAASAPTAGS